MLKLIDVPSSLNQQQIASKNKKQRKRGRAKKATAYTKDNEEEAEEKEQPPRKRKKSKANRAVIPPPALPVHRQPDAAVVLLPPAAPLVFPPSLPPVAVARPARATSFVACLTEVNFVSATQGFPEPFLKTCLESILLEQNAAALVTKIEQSIETCKVQPQVAVRATLVETVLRELRQHAQLRQP